MSHFPQRSFIAGIGRYLPERIVTSKEIEEKLELKHRLKVPENLIEMFTGVQERRYAEDGVQSSDLALWAAQQALERSGYKPEDLDVVIFSATTHDHMEPATACVLQAKLGAKNAVVYDVKNACNSFVNGVDVMDSLIRTGKAKVGLVASGEVGSRFINWKIENRKDLERKFAGLTVGDAGGAFVMTASPDGERGIVNSHFFSDGTNWDLAIVEGGGTVAPRDPEKMYFLSESKKLVQLGITHVPRVFQEALEQTGWTMEEVDMHFTHQVSKMAVEKVAELLGEDTSKTLFTIVKYGNTASASIPVAVCEAYEKGMLKPGMKVMLGGVASGFSAGFISVIW
ncbi:MAG: ketoacyl-ACP synthase III [Deltaproteobacteria bacterium]|nr:MAG: ketoacyl-ACP synthase III [Deltaproteobacteria bacterium]